MSRRNGRLAATGLLAVLFGVLLVTALVPAPVVFLLAATGVVVLETLLDRRAPGTLPELLDARLGLPFRLLVLDVLTALLAGRADAGGGAAVALVVLALVALSAGRALATALVRRAAWWRPGGPLGWRGLDVPGLPVPGTARELPLLDAGFAALSLPIPLGLALGAAPASLAAELVVAVAVLVVGGQLLRHLLVDRRPLAVVRHAVREAVAAHAPQVVLHHSGRRGTAEQVLLWAPYLHALDRRCLVIVREADHLDDLADCGLPVVWAPTAEDVELLVVPSVDLALYPSDSTNVNNHLLRVPGVYDVLIGHGDADEAESRSPVARMYDEIWVAGAAGRLRYAAADRGVPARKVKEIGAVRPPSTAVAAPPRPTVVYAPAWEQVDDAADLSSLLRRGGRVLDALLARQDVRTLFVPAAASGARDPRVADEVERLRRRVALAGEDHAVWPAERLPEALAVAAFAVVDVSPALAEAVRADVPFGVPAPRGLDAAAVVAAFPTVAAGTVLTELPHDVFAALDDALGEDRHAAARLETGRRIDSSGDVVARFRSAVDEAIAAQRRRRAR